VQQTFPLVLEHRAHEQRSDGITGKPLDVEHARDADEALHRPVQILQPLLSQKRVVAEEGGDQVCPRAVPTQDDAVWIPPVLRDVAPHPFDSPVFEDIVACQAKFVTPMVIQKLVRIWLTWLHRARARGAVPRASIGS
jgi:hypothetical protein